MSLPAPPVSTSSPSPPSSVSAPALPRRVSSPPPPKSSSAPPSPVRMLFSASPCNRSFPDPPRTFSKFVNWSEPAEVPSEVPAPRSTSTPAASELKESVSLPAPPSRVSSPCPPSMVSAPRPVRMILSELSPNTVSEPSPVTIFSTPLIVSLPVSTPETVPLERSTETSSLRVSKFAVSMPDPPIISSSPPKAVSKSLPAPPSSRLAPSLPIMTSSPSPPMTFSNPSNSSDPLSAPSAVPSVRLTLTPLLSPTNEMVSVPAPPVS